MTGDGLDSSNEEAEPLKEEGAGETREMLEVVEAEEGLRRRCKLFRGKVVWAASVELGGER